MASPRPTTNYSLDEVEQLIENFDLLRVAATRRISWLVRLCDVERAIQHMPPKEYQAVLLIGLIGFDTRTVGTTLGVSYVTAWRRYRRGLDWIVNYLNTGGH